MSAAQTERLAVIAQQALAAAHGERGAIYAMACQELGTSLATLHRKLKQVAVKPARKRRADAGQTSLTLPEARLISAYWLGHIRRNGKQIKRLEDAVSELRCEGKILAGRVDAETGEFFPLSLSSIRRALVGYCLHPDQLLAPAPVTPLRSDYPNQVWQIDASLCVLYKLPVQGERIIEVKAEEYYKNKLGHLAKIEHLLVQRYVITDHASAATYVHFGLGGESAQGLVEALVAAMLERPGFPFFGAPDLIMLDQASANRSALFRNLCKALGVRLHYTQPGNPRSKGQVECAHNIVECSLESGLKMAPEIRDVGQLNALAQQWLHWFNGTRVHSRHGLTRYAAWQLIKPGQLRKVGMDRAALLALATEEPVLKPVGPYLTIHFKGKLWNVSSVPGVFVEQKLSICRNAWQTEMAMVVLTGADGREVFHAVPEKQTEGAFGFFVDAARIIEGEYRRFADTPAQSHRKDLELLATGSDTLEGAAKARKDQAALFGGEINPYKAMQDYTPPVYFPSRGTELEILAPTVALPPVALPQAAMQLMRAIPDWGAAHYAWLSGRFPEGVPQVRLEALADLAAEVCAGVSPVVDRVTLRLVG